MNLRTIITQSVPYGHADSVAIAKSLGVSLGVVYFIFVFLEPFNFSISEEYNKYTVVFVFTCFYFFALFLSLKWLLPGISKLFKVRHLYIYHFVLGYLVLIVVVAMVHTSLQNYLNGLAMFSFSRFTTTLWHALLIGMIPTLIVSLLSHVMILKEQKKQGIKDWSSALKPVKQTGQVVITSDNAKNQFCFEADSIVYIKSEDNYISVFHRKGTTDGIQHQLIRTTLKNLTPQLSLPFLRVHRSYLINLNHVHKVVGNAQGMALSINTLSEKIPVSRSYVPQFKTALKSL